MVPASSQEPAFASEPAADSAAGGSLARRLQQADVPALAVALLAYAFVHGGLVLSTAAPGVQIGLIVAIAVAFVASSATRAAVAAGVGVLLGALVEAPLHVDGPLLVAATAVVVAAAAAFGLRWVVDHGQLRKSLVVAVGVALIIGNFWLTTATLDSSQVVFENQTMFQFLTTRPNMNQALNDQSWYLGIVGYMKDGTPYYQAFRRAYHENLIWKSDPPSILAVREPLLPEFLAHLPGDGRSAIWAMALLVTLAAGLSTAMADNVAEPAVRLISMAAVAAFFVNFTTMPFIMGFEPWGGALAVVCVGLFALASRSTDRTRRRWLMAASALVAVLAVATRELMLFLPAAGFLAAIFAEPENRRFDLGVWVAAIVGCGAALGAHALAAQRIVTPAHGLSKWLGLGSIENVALGIANGARYISGAQWLLVALGLLGVVGAALQRRRQYQVFALVCTVTPLLFFLVAWNRAIDVATGHNINYWGAIVSPVLFALAVASLGPLLEPLRLTGPSA